MAEQLIIEVAGLRKTYDGVEALRGLDLQLPAGSICGFLGRNGAGKTTTMKILFGMAHPTSGRARVFDLDAALPEASLEIRRRAAFVSEEKDLYPYMTVEDIIRFTAAFYPQWSAELQQRYLRKFELPLQSSIKTLSRGNRTKLALLLALCRGAELLILDEPTSGLDPAMADDVLQALIGHVAGGKTTVFFSSHQIAEVEQVADRVVMIDRGRTIVAGDLDDLRATFRRVDVVFEGEAPPIALRAAGVLRVVRKGRVLTVFSSAGSDAIVDEVRALRPSSIDVVLVTLKEIFLEATRGEE